MDLRAPPAVVVSYARQEKGARKMSGRGRQEFVTPPLGNLQKAFVLAVHQMIELLELPPGWNSYNAKPIRKENVAFATTLLAGLMREDTPVPNIVPTAGGGVQFEWHVNGIDLEISIDAPNRFHFVAEEIGREGSLVEGTESELPVLSEWIARLSDGQGIAGSQTRS